MTIANTSANTFLQSAAPPRLRGETASLFMLAMRGGHSLGALVTGASISLIGVREALAVNGAIALSALAIIGRAWLRAGAVVKD